MRDDVLLHYGVKGMKWRQRKGKVIGSSPQQKTEESVNLVERRMQQVKRETQARQARQRMFMDEARKTVDKAKNAMTKDAKKKQIQKGIKINQIKREWDEINDKVNPSRAKRKPKARPM